MPSAPLSLRLLALYPKRAGSALVGLLVHVRWPWPLRRPLLRAFASTIHANLEEAEKRPEEYASFLDFFTRRLKPGVRSQAAPEPGVVSSPVDGRIVSGGRIAEGTLIQAKGLPYRLDELLANDPLARHFSGGSFLTLYLSPRDYHRIHVPVDGVCLAIARIDGELWPVNDASTAHTPGLYVRNRRAYWIAEGNGTAEGLVVACVNVAATHVGGVPLDARWTGGTPLRNTERREVPRVSCAPGDDLGAFELGSTVVVLVGGPRAAEWKPARGNGFVKLGEKLGAF